MPQPYKSLIFDLDGVLWNAIPRTVEGWNRAFELWKEPRRVTQEELIRVTGRPYQECIEILFPQLLQKIPNLAEKLDPFEKEEILQKGGEFYPGVLEGVKTLTQSYDLFLVSNCQDWYLGLFFEASGLQSCFKAWDCNGLSGLSKSEMLVRLKENNNLNGTVYIGDTEGDYQAAQAAKMDFVWASYGFGEVQNPPQLTTSFEMLMYFLGE